MLQSTTIFITDISFANFVLGGYKSQILIGKYRLAGLIVTLALTLEFEGRCDNLPCLRLYAVSRSESVSSGDYVTVLYVSRFPCSGKEFVVSALQAIKSDIVSITSRMKMLQPKIEKFAIAKVCAEEAIVRTYLESSFCGQPL